MVLRCFFFNDTATTEIYTLSLHDALPIFEAAGPAEEAGQQPSHATPRAQATDPAGDATRGRARVVDVAAPADRKSPRLNSRHANISYAVFCFKKKKNILS